MSQGRILPLVGPLLVLYLVADVVASGSDLDPTALGLCVLGLAVAALPPWLLRGVRGSAPGRVSALGMAAGAVLVRAARPELPSLYLDLASALAAPTAGLLALHLALDTPDQPAPLARRRRLFGALIVLGVAAAVGSLLAAAPALSVFGALLLVPSAWEVAALAFGVAMLGGALALRLARRRLGSTPEALAAGGWAQLGLIVALGIAMAMAGARFFGASSASSAVARGLIGLGASALLAGHVAMIGARRQVHAGRNARRLLAGALAVGAVAWLASVASDRVPHDSLSSASFVAFTTVLAALVFAAARVVVRQLFAPFGARLLDGAEEALDGAVGATTLDELGAVVLPPLRRASKSIEADPFLYVLDPPREVRVDAAGVAHVEERELSVALRERMAEKPGEIVVAAPIAEQVVRRADLRPLADALARLDALCVVPLAVDRELEGALVVPRGRRRGALTLEEIDRLERLGRHLASQVAMLAAHERSRQRTRDAVVARDRIAEELDVAKEELSRLRADASSLKAGGPAERFREPAIAYSPAMRKLTRRVEEVGPIDAPVLLLGEAGSGLDRIGHLIHAAGGRRDGPFVVADCAAVRPERSEAALFGESEGSRPGWLRLADGGTCLLLDAPALSRQAQAKLAEAIATRRGALADGAGSYPIDARVIATSRVDLATLASSGLFEPELHKRLAPLAIEVPPLRDRREDLPSLVLLALDRACRTAGRPVIGVDPSAMEVLTAHDWPGNLRELTSVIDRAVASARDSNVRVGDLPPLAPTVDTVEAGPLDGTYAEIEARALEHALARAGGNKSEAARLLGLKRTTFVDKLKRYDLGASIPPPVKLEDSEPETPRKKVGAAAGR